MQARRGVRLHDFDLQSLKTLHLVRVLGAEKAVWFSDSGGSLLCLQDEMA